MLLLAKNIRYLRKKNDMSQETLAEMLGYKSYTTIQKWEMGTSDPPIGQLAKIANVFNESLDDITKTDLEMRDAQTLSDDRPGYYFDDEAKELAQFLFKNPDYRVLFDAARNVKKEDLMFVKEFIDRFSK